MSAAFKPIRVLGLMSGTSFDGVDGAVVKTDGQAEIEFLDSGFEPYTDRERDCLRDSMGKWPQDGVAAAREIVHDAHTRLARRLDADVVAFHGQTLAHDPENARTHQLGDGACLAQSLGRPVVWDFRSEDMRKGGQGAPLAPFFHHALARRAGFERPVVFLNLGGVANVSWVNPSISYPEEEGALVAFDTGPANALIDDLVMDRLGLAHDAGGRIAGQGRVHEPLLEGLGYLPFVLQKPPKSLDRNDFMDFYSRAQRLEPEDAAASLVELTARCVGAACGFFPEPPQRWLVSGGGRHNATMIRAIGKNVGAVVEPIEVAGLDGDMLEAQAFAWLGVRVMRGLPNSGPSTTGAHAPVVGGVVSGGG